MIATIAIAATLLPGQLGHLKATATVANEAIKGLLM
jgi:hypothetical protein